MVSIIFTFCWIINYSIQNQLDRCYFNIKKGFELHPDNQELLRIQKYLEKTLK